MFLWLKTLYRKRAVTWPFIFYTIIWTLSFFPFGVLLNVNFKGLSFSKKLGIIFLVSFFAEFIQFLFGIGVADITDVITNTTGGLIGLWFYQLLNKHISTNKLDRLAVILGYVLLLFLIVAFLFLTRTIRLR